MTEPVFVDTNVWVYAVDAADPDKRARALAAIAPEPGRDLVVSTQVLTEFYAVVTRKLAVPVPAEDAEAMVRQLSLLPVVAVDASLVLSAIAGSGEWQVSIWDALILPTLVNEAILLINLGPGRRVFPVASPRPTQGAPSGRGAPRPRCRSHRCRRRPGCRFVR